MTAKNWIQFRVRDLVAATLIICLILGWWVERTQRHELARSIAQLGSRPWIQIYDPSSSDKWDVGAGQMGINGHAFFPSTIPRSTKVTFELLSGSDSIYSSALETRRVDARTLDFVGNARMTNLRPGFYFLNVEIVDAESNEVLATQGEVIEFIDSRPQQKRRTN